MKIKFLDSDLEYVSDEQEVELFRVCKKVKAPINFGCRIGGCGVCLVNIVSGAENLSPKTDEEEHFTDFEYERLACQCLVKGDVSIEQPKKSNKSSNVGSD